VLECRFEVNPPSSAFRRMSPIAKAGLNRLRLGVALIVSASLLAGCERTLTTETQTRSGMQPQLPRLIVNTGDYVKVYIHAFQDDWELYMGDRVVTGLQTVPNIVWVYTSAGDANFGTAFWQYREQAAQKAMDAILGTGAWTCANQAVQTHTIWRCVKGAAVAYFMRLPDGGTTGDGYGTRGSMARLRDGAQPSLAAIDGSTTYNSWADLYTTIRAIVDYESNNQSAPFVEIDAPEYDRVTNANDHPDHFATADAVQAAAATRSWNLSWYVDYQTKNLAVNLGQVAHDSKQLSYYAYDNYMGVGGYGRSQYESDPQAWLGRTYFRTSISAPPPPPATPTNLQAQTVSATKIDLTWTDNATNETGYYVERAPDQAGVAGTYAQVASLPANVVSYSNTGLTSSSRYWFRVRAFNTSDVSGYSPAVSATTLLLPAAPTNLQGQAVSTTRIDLTWTANATNETAYTVERAPNNAGVAGTFAQIASLPAGATAYSNTGLNATTTYWYRVRAENATDVSAYSSQISVTTPQGPAAPTNLVATATSPTQINLTWVDNSTTETGYTVERAPDNSGTAGTFAAIATVPANSVSFSDVTVSENTRYWYRVRGFTAVDVSAYSGLASTTTPQSPPAAPTNLQAQPLSSSSIGLNWTDNATNESGFLIDRAPDAGGSAGTFAQIASVAANVVTFTSGLLNPSTKYWFRVRAFNSAQNSVFTNLASATTLAPPTSRTDIYVHAHQDDWQLFMGDRVYNSVQVATKVVFVYASAGDAGQGTTYWQTREHAAEQAVSALLGSGSFTCAQQVINTHPIRRCVKGKSVSYDMRLPDGRTNGEGFNGNGSMANLRDGNQSTLASLDGSTTYTSWADLYTTIRDIIDFESGNLSAPYVEVHAPETNRTTNAGDHSDHLAVGDAVQQAAATRSWNISWYIDYQIQFMTVNLSQAAHDIKQLSFYAYDNVMGAAGYGRNQYESDYQAWLWRTYFRTTTR
jgi:LmbE family N-acetylglucosaminyl deacetylase